MKAQVRHVDDHGVRYDALAFVCPGCAAAHSNSGLHMLAVNTTAKSPAWDWDGDLEAPTLSPSILTTWGNEGFRCHSFLKAGVFDFLSDSSHELAGCKVAMGELPEWFTDESERGA